MKRELSVLIPVYEDDCRKQVSALSRLLEAAQLQRYELIVADDGSPDRHYVDLCRQVETLPHVRFVGRKVNVGRASIRNFLATEASCEWLLFVDAGLMPADDDFINRYMTAEGDGIVCGDYRVANANLPSNLRYRYETAIANQHSADQRRQRPYHHFHTANFLVARKVMLHHPFDERFRHYGYEDVLFGKQLRLANICIDHIDNPVVFGYFEPNSRFVSKTEESLTTLFLFRRELRGYSRLLTIVEGIHLRPVKWAIRLWHKLFGPIERRLLCGNRPLLSVFKLYKLGFFLSLNDQQTIKQ